MQKQRSTRSKLRTDSDDDIEDDEEESNETMRLKMLNGERLKMKGSIYESFTNT